MRNNSSPSPENKKAQRLSLKNLADKIFPSKQNRGEKSRAGNRSSLRARLILANMVITLLTIAGMGYYVFSRAQQINTYLTDTLNESVNQQAEAILQKASAEQVDALDNFFVSLRKDITNLGETTGKYLSREAQLANNSYWDATQALSRLPSGSWDNPNNEQVSVFIPASVELTERLISELNTLIQLDFIAPVLLTANPDTVAIYFGGLTKETFYYPNVDLATLVPVDFDVTQRPWFVNAAPSQNPEKLAVWADPYLDAAANGLVITTSIPVYDSSGKFRGVVAMDIQLNRITEIVSNIKVGETGHAFLLDSGKRLIAMPAAAYQDFGITPEAYPLGNVLDQPTQISPDFWEIVNRMGTGESGLEAVTINGIENFVIYGPIPEVGYNLAIVIPSRELLTSAATARDEITTSIRDTLINGGLLAAALLVLSFFATLFIGNRLTAPLRALTSTAEEITKGNIYAKASVQGSDEIGLLATAFNSMTSQMRDLIGTLEQRVADRTKALTTSTEVSRRLSTILNEKLLVSEVVEQVQTAFQYYHAHIYFVEDATGDLVMAGGTGDAGATLLARGHRVMKGRGLVGRSAETNAPILVTDVSQEVGWLPNPLLPETKSEVAIPISVGNKVLGVLDVQQNVVNGLGENDVQLLQSIAGQVAISIQNTRTLEESRTRAELETLVNTIGQKIQRTASMEETLQTAIREIGQALGASRVIANINRPEDGSQEPGVN